MYPNKKTSKNDEIPHFRKENNQNMSKLLEKFPDNYKTCRFILLDTETTGLDIKIDRLISINAVEMINCELTGIQFNAYLNKRFTGNMKPLMYYLSDYNYSREDNIKKSLETFLSFVSDSIIITHNALFDMKFINAELKRCGLRQIPLGQCICTLKILNNLKKIGRLDKNFRLRLCDLCRYYDIRVDKKDLHQGIVDTIVFGRCVAKMFEDGIYNDFDNYDYEEANSFVNYTHFDIDQNFDSSSDDESYRLNEEENKTEDEKEKPKEYNNEFNNKQPMSKSEEKKRNKNNKSFDKKYNNYYKYNNFYKENFYNEDFQNNIDNSNNNNDENKRKKNYNNKNYISKSYINPNKNYNLKNYDEKLSFWKDKNKSVNNNISKVNKEEPKISFLKNAFKSYIKDNNQKINYKNVIINNYLI